MKRKEKKPDIVPYRHEVLSKSNYFIGTKYKASVLENQVTYLAMLKIQEGEYKEKNDGIYVTLNAAEIKKATHSKNGSFYDNLKRVADEMTGNNMGIVDDENKRFEFITLINKATYAESKFTIRFALELRDHLIDVQKNFTYTNLNKNIAMSLKKKPASIPLYELLKSQCFYPNSYRGEKNYIFSVSIGLSELKLDIGVVNIKDSPDVKRALRLGTGTQEDYDRAVAKSKDKMYETWTDFDRKCLRKTVEEINAVSDIYVEYKKITKGRGGKVYGVEFIVYLNGAEKTGKDNVKVTLGDDENIHIHMTEAEKFQLYYDVLGIVSEYGIGINDVTAICEAADMDKNKVVRACEMLEEAKNVDNATAWLISCIKKKYWENEKISFSGTKKNNSFLAMETHDYSEEEMLDFEKIMLAKD